MKKLTLILIGIILTTIIPVQALDLSDIDSHWAKSNIETLISKGIVNGYPDGTFKPNGTVNADAFIKMVVTALGYQLENGKEYWASTYIDKAVELGLLEDGDIENYAIPINRYNMAKIATRALNEDYDEYYKAYIGLFNATESLDDVYKDYVLKSASKGIITGYPDGAFGGEKNMTRAEAAVVINRIIDKDVRVKYPAAEPDYEFEEFMRTEEANKYTETEIFKDIKDGIVYFSPEETRWNDLEQVELLPTYSIPNANQMVYNLMRDMINYARENGLYVHLKRNKTYTHDSKNDYVLFRLYESKNHVEITNFNDNIFGLGINFVDEQPEENFKIKSDKPLYIWWNINEFYDVKTANAYDVMEDPIEYLENISWTMPVYDKALKIMCKAVYPNTGEKIHANFMNEYQIAIESDELNGTGHVHKYIDTVEIFRKEFFTSHASYTATSLE